MVGGFDLYFVLLIKLPFSYKIVFDYNDYKYPCGQNVIVLFQIDLRKSEEFYMSSFVIMSFQLLSFLLLSSVYELFFFHRI